MLPLAIVCYPTLPPMRRSPCPMPGCRLPGQALPLHVVVDHWWPNFGRTGFPLSGGLRGIYGSAEEGKSARACARVGKKRPPPLREKRRSRERRVCVLLTHAGSWSGMAMERVPTPRRGHSRPASFADRPRMNRRAREGADERAGVRGRSWSTARVQSEQSMALASDHHTKHAIPISSPSIRASRNPFTPVRPTVRDGPPALPLAPPPPSVFPRAE